MDCPDEDALAALVEGALAAADARAIEAHVDACAACHALLAAYGQGQAEGATTHGAFALRLRDAQPLAPRTPVGRYVVLDWIGEGGAGVVYAAYDPELDRKIALKLLRSAQQDAERVNRALLREGRAMAKLAHPNVVSVHDVGMFDARVFLAMEFVAGGTLRTWLRDDDRSLREIVDVFVMAALGLAAAHAAKLAHGDFKPENVLIGEDGRARVTDFGLALLAEAAPSSGREGAEHATRIAGTPAYMAPEQKLGRPPDARSDQYSFCVALHEALHGVRPGDATPSGGRTWQRDVPARIRKVLERGLAADRDARYPSMEELLVDLAWRDPPSRSNRALVAGAALVAAIGVAWGAAHRSAADPGLVCRGSEQRLAGIWDDARKASISKAFVASGKTYAPAVWRGVERTLDTYTHDWVAMRTDACEATRVRGEQSASLLDLRMACLDERREEMRALVDVLADADPAAVQNGLGAAEGLTPLARCADARALTAGAKAPPAAVAAKVRELEDQLPRVRALFGAGRYREAVPLAHDIAQAAEKTGFGPLEGRALYEEGRVLNRSGEYAAAAETLYRAAWEADAAGDERTRVFVWAELLDVVAVRQEKADMVPLLTSQGLAALARLGPDRDAEGALQVGIGHGWRLRGDAQKELEAYDRALALAKEAHSPESRVVVARSGMLGDALLELGEVDRALEVYAEALRAGEKALGADHPNVFLIDSGVGCAFAERLDFAEAEVHFRRTLARVEANLGKDHPSLSADLDNLGEVLTEEGKYSESLSYYERSLALLSKSARLDHSDTRIASLGIGRARARMGDPAAALPHLERAIQPPVSEDDRVVAQARFELARVLTAVGREPARAKELARKARDTFRANTKTPLRARDVATVESWLAAHP